MSTTADRTTNASLTDQPPPAPAAHAVAEISTAAIQPPLRVVPARIDAAAVCTGHSAAAAGPDHLVRRIS